MRLNDLANLISDPEHEHISVAWSCVRRQWEANYLKRPGGLIRVGAIMISAIGRSPEDAWANLIKRIKCRNS